MNLGVQTNWSANFNDVNWGQALRSGVLGGAAGLFGVSSFGLGWQVMLNANLGIGSSILDGVFLEDDFSWGSLVGGKISGGVAPLLSSILVLLMPGKRYMFIQPSALNTLFREITAATISDILLGFLISHTGFEGEALEECE